MATIGDRIRQARETHGISQAKLARRIAISPNALNKIELGKTPDPRVSTVTALAYELGISMEALAPPAPAPKKRRAG